jgi:hypothetical protein
MKRRNFVFGGLAAIPFVGALFESQPRENGMTST